MPLIPLDYIKAWYRTDSWVYRQFAFVFKNRLWDKAIPKGMACCPFFWLSVFSVLILRPFVGAILIIRWAARSLHLSDLLRWTDTQVKRVFGEDGAPITLGMPTFVTGLVLSICLFILSIWSYLLYCSVIGQTVALFILGHVTLFGAFLAAYITDKQLYPKWRVRFAEWGAFTLIVGTMAGARPDLFYPIRHDWGVVLSYVGVAVGHWVYGLFTGTGHMIADLVIILWAYWPFYLAFTAFLALSAAISWHIEPSRIYLKESYLDVRLRKVRAAIMDVISEHVALHIHRQTSLRGDKALAIAKSSDIAWRMVKAIVDSEAWLKVDLSRLGLSISGERMDQIAEAVLTEWREDRATEKRVKAWRARMDAMSQLVHASLAYRWLHIAGTQVVTLACVVWELFKAKRQGWCPYLSFSGPDGQPIPADPAPEVVALQPTHLITNQTNTTIYVQFNAVN